MRIAYLSPYQGRTLLARRPIVRNLSLACNMKTEVVAELLVRRGHSVEVISPGMVVERRLKFYPAFSEPTPIAKQIPVFYASALPVRFVNGIWSQLRTLALFQARHRHQPFDLLIIYNLWPPQLKCAHYARRLRLPVVLDYEDDEFVDIDGKSMEGEHWRHHLVQARQTLASLSGCFGVSPQLLGQAPATIPKALVRGVIGDDFLDATPPEQGRQNWVVFSGTHYGTKGLQQLISAWRKTKLPGWELHIAGRGELTPVLEEMAKGDPSIVFRGLLNRHENARFLGQGKIGINPHDLSQTPGNVFATKIVEYLAAGLHVISTRMGELEPELEAGITYLADNTPETIAVALQALVKEGSRWQTSREAVIQRYGPDALSERLDILLQKAAGRGVAVAPNETAPNINT